MTTPTLPTPEQWRHWGVDPRWSRTAHAAGHVWHLLESAPEPPTTPLATIVCVHGNPTWSILWRSMLGRLGDRYRVIAVDQLGMGWSDRTSSRTYRQRVDDLAAVIDTLGIDGPLVLVGHDWGGAVAMGWAVAHPDRLAGLVLCNTGIAVPPRRRAPWLIRLAAAAPIRRLVCERTRVFVAGTAALSRRRLDTSTREALAAPYRRRTDRQAIADFVGDVPFDDRHPSASAIGDVADRLTDLRAPVLLAWGARDPVFDDSFALDLGRRLPAAALHRVADAGHLAPLETDLAQVVDVWLRDTAGVATTTTDGHDPTPAPAPTWSALVERACDDDIAYVDVRSATTTTFRQLHDRVMAIAAGLAAEGLEPGDRVAMLVPPSADLVAAIYGVWRAGGVTVVADRGLGLAGLGRAVRGAHVDWVIGPPAALAVATAARWAPGARLVATGSRRVPGALTTLERLAGTSGPPPPEPSPDAPAAVLHTSGATGPAKGVRYTHRQLSAQRDALAAAYGITRDDRLVAAFAPFALYGPALGIASTIPDVDVTTPGALTATALADACRAISATIVFASPAALANVVVTADGRELPPIRLGLSAGAPVPSSTLRAMSALTPGAEWHTPYGMTECLPVADIELADIERADTSGDGRGVCVGHPVVGAEVVIAPLAFDATAVLATVETGATGEVMVRTPWLSAGYDRRWAVERDARPLDADGRTWHRSGDVGHLDHAGRLWIEGRAVHVIHADGGPLTPVPIERAVEALDAVARSAAVGIGPVGCQQLVVVVEPAPDTAERDEGLADDVLATDVRRTVVEVLGYPVAAVLVVTTLPVDIRHNTKIDRTLIARWASAVLSGDRTRRPW